MMKFRYLISPSSFWRGYAYIFWIAMDTTWMAFWYIILIPSGQRVSYIYAFVFFYGCYLAIFYLMRKMNYLAWRIQIKWSILLTFLIFWGLLGLRLLLIKNDMFNLRFREIIDYPLGTISSIFSILPGEYLLLFLIVFFWWRGITRSNELVSPTLVYKYFLAGVIMFLLFILAIPWTLISPHIPFILFIFFGLQTQLSSRLAILNRFRGGQSKVVSGQWFIGLFLSISTLVSSALLIGNFIGIRGYIVVRQFYEFILMVFGIIISPLLVLLLNALINLFSLIHIGSIIQNLLEFISRLQNYVTIFINQWIRNINSWELLNLDIYFRNLEIFRRVILWVSLIIAVMLILLISRKSQRFVNDRNINDDDELFEDIASNVSIRNILKSKIHNIANRFNKISFISGLRRFLIVAKIRRIYAELLDISAALGSVRLPSKTPLEFLDTLNQLFPDYHQELFMITQAYLHVRYGGYEIEQKEINQLTKSWEVIKKQGKKNMTALKRH